MKPFKELNLSRALGSQSIAWASYLGGHISKKALSSYFTKKEFEKIEAYLAQKEKKK